MIDCNTLALFITASVLLALAPGPDNIFVLTQSITMGRGAGMIITLGLCTGLVAHTTIVALGVAALFQNSLIAFNVLKYIGAVYLLYLAWRAFVARGEGVDAGGKPLPGAWALYRRGIFMNVTNPKVSLFFMAFLPQFADPLKGSMTLQLVFLGMLFIVVTLVIFGTIGLLAGAIGRLMARSKRWEGVMNKIAGVVFVSLALKLIMTGQK